VTDIAWAVLSGSAIVAGSVIYAACAVAASMPKPEAKAECKYQPPQNTSYAVDRRGAVIAPQKVR
jgi:hypothetical protein